MYFLSFKTNYYYNLLNNNYNLISKLFYKYQISNYLMVHKYNNVFTFFLILYKTYVHIHFWINIKNFLHLHILFDSFSLTIKYLVLFYISKLHLMVLYPLQLIAQFLFSLFLYTSPNSNLFLFILEFLFFLLLIHQDLLYEYIYMQFLYILSFIY